MAGALVGGAFLSGFINVVFDRLLSPEAANLIRGKKLDQDLVERLKIALCAAEALLVDAEMKQIHDKNVQHWLDSLRDAVYLADDLLDHVFTKAATQKEVSNFFSRISRISINFQDRKIVKKMEDVVKRIENLEKRKYILGLKEIPRENLSWRTPSTCLVGESTYGREKDQDAIINMLLDDNTESEISVMAILGIGGIGKTTLAQLVYNTFIKEFDLKAWVCVSEESDILKVTKSIINAIGSGGCDKNDLNLLQLDLKEKLSGKKFFIVLDDVWNIDYHGWNSLKKPFQYGNKGSKILVTTRSGEVASTFQACRPYFLKELSEEHCWSIFAKHACFSEPNENSTLEKIGREIVKKCKGLPLAAETLGALFRTKHDVKDWNTILTSDIWEFSLKDSKIIPALLISYYHLPPHLKRCFAYCSLYPKDYEFSKYELILLWMAEDLLPPPKRGGTLEEVGYQCFDDLFARLFFKYTEWGDFVMHDLLHDLAIFVAGDFYFRFEELGNADKMKSHSRHLSYARLSHPMSKNFDFVDQVKSLRTCLPIKFSNPSFGIENLAFIIVPRLKCLRVLSFSCLSQLDVLPDSIGELIHLRYLNLSHTSIKTFPESLGDLYNLQTLRLYNCSELIMLPGSMQNLVNLRHLDIDYTNLKEMPRGMSKLKHLQGLSYFVVGEHEENGIKELGELSNLHGSLNIMKLENVASSSEALEARIMDKKHIDHLYFYWSVGDNKVITSTQAERDIFERLQPHTGLKGLTIKGYRGTRFSNWVGHSSYINMTRVSLSSCSSCCMLPSLGQLPSLESLDIEDFTGLVIIDTEFYKNDDDDQSLATPFPSLVKLSFHGMSSWEKWRSYESDAFPQLESLSISDCPRLMGCLPNHLPSLKVLYFRRCPGLTEGDLPNHFPALETLEIRECEQLVSSLPRTPTIRKLVISESNKVELQELPQSLQSLSARGCKVVESMFQGISHSTCLQSLSLSDCSCSLSFPKGCLPESLKKLQIYYCRHLEFPKQQQQKHESLESLQIRNSCDSLTAFTLEVFPNLKTLKITDCENMESLSLPQSLDSLSIEGCPNFVSFPREGLAAPTMTHFRVSQCNKLKSLPCHMNTLLPNLDDLWIKGCPDIDSFPEGGLPPSLKTLRIYDCEKLLSGLSSMGVHQGLTDLTIDGGTASDSVKSFPKEGLLPHLPSLTSLSIESFSSVETLECKELLHLTSLQQLTIEYCPKLENMRGERLPASLIKLEIRRSPLLEERCEKKHPQIWPKISHIRGIYANWRWIS